MADPFQDAQEDVEEQQRWGESLSDRALRKMLVVLRVLVQRVKRLEERMDKVDPPNR